MNYIMKTGENVIRLGKRIHKKLEHYRENDRVIYLFFIFIISIACLIGFALFLFTLMLPFALVFLGAGAVVLKTRSIYHHAFGINVSKWEFNTVFSIIGFLNQMATASSMGQDEHTFKKSLLDENDASETNKHEKSKMWDEFTFMMYMAISVIIILLICVSILNPFSFFFLIPWWILKERAYVRQKRKQAADYVYQVSSEEKEQPPSSCCEKFLLIGLLLNLFLGSLIFFFIGWAIYIPLLLILCAMVSLLFNELFYRWVTTQYNDRDTVVLVLTDHLLEKSFRLSAKAKDRSFFSYILRTILLFLVNIYFVRFDPHARLRYMNELKMLKIKHYRGLDHDSSLHAQDPIKRNTLSKIRQTVSRFKCQLIRDFLKNQANFLYDEEQLDNRPEYLYVDDQDINLFLSSP